VGVKTHQKWTKSRIVARKGGFFFGFAEQKPNVLGGRSFWRSLWLPKMLLPPRKTNGRHFVQPVNLLLRNPKVAFWWSYTTRLELISEKMSE
jgi:hypothetical protein